MLHYFSNNYSGDPFVLFGAAHLWSIAILGVAGVFIFRAARASENHRKDQIRITLASILLLNEIGWHVWNLAHGVWDYKESLPFHMCSAMIWISIYALLFEKRQLYPLLYFLGVAGSIQAIITPDAGIYGYPHFRFFQTMIAHGGLVLAGLWVVLVEKYRPDFSALGKILIGLNIYALLVWFVNLGLGSNYLYINAKPDTASVMDFFPEWPWYIFMLEVLAIVFLGLLYWPFRNSREETAMVQR